MFSIIGTSEISSDIYPSEHASLCNQAFTGENNTNYQFNQYVYSIIDKRPLSALELGCGGGGIIEHFLNDKNLAIGLDGGPAYEHYKAQSWSKIPLNLFKCDISKPFQILYQELPIKFDLIYSWECIEHIYEPDTLTLMENISNHSHNSTYFIGGISNRECQGHINIKTREVWLELFKKIGFKEYPAPNNNVKVRNLADSMYFFLKR